MELIGEEVRRQLERLLPRWWGHCDRCGNYRQLHDENGYALCRLCTPLEDEDAPGRVYVIAPRQCIVCDGHGCEFCPSVEVAS